MLPLVLTAEDAQSMTPDAQNRAAGQRGSKPYGLGGGGGGDGAGTTGIGATVGTGAGAGVGAADSSVGATSKVGVPVLIHLSRVNCTHVPT